MGAALAGLFLIASGFAGWHIFQIIHRSAGENFGRSEVAFFGPIMFGIWIFALNSLVLKFFYPLNSIACLIQHFNRLDFVLFFGGLAFISMIVAALIWEIVLSGLVPLLADAFLRMNFFRRAIIPDRNVWDIMFQHDNNPHAVLVEKAGKVIGTGLVKRLSGNGSHLKEIYLEKNNDDVLELLGFRGTYINFDADLIIREYELRGRATHPKKAARKVLKIKRS